MAKILSAIHAQESKKANAVVAQPKEMKLKGAAQNMEDSVDEAMAYCDFPYEH